MAMEVEADLTTLPADSESWSEVLYSGNFVDCRVDSHTAETDLVTLKLNTQSEEDQSASEAHKETAHRSWAALSFRFPSGDLSQIDSGRAYLTRVGFCWRREVATNEQEYPPNERDLVGCVGVETGDQTVTGRRLDAGYWVESVSDQSNFKKRWSVQTYVLNRGQSLRGLLSMEGMHGRSRRK